ncbi:MAG: hypothetical protein K2X93_09665 [Candidatus Obscuribacterales bacterium]|nr:hypothetical protein [Candidatus Obscuribacterales bacterium]
MKLANYYHLGTIIVCAADLVDSIRSLAGVSSKLDLFGAVTGSVVALWLIVALLVLIESIRKDRVVAAALFYVVTMATFLITTPVLPNSSLGHLVEGVIMFANIVVHAIQFAKRPKTAKAGTDVEPSAKPE